MDQCARAGEDCNLRDSFFETGGLISSLNNRARVRMPDVQKEENLEKKETDVGLRNR